MSGLRHDLSAGFRALRKNWAQTLVVVVTLAVCLGANTSMFALVNAVILHPLRVPDADRILLMANQYPRIAGRRVGVTSSIPDYFDRLKSLTVFDEQALYVAVTETVQRAGVPTPVLGWSVTPSLFRLLGVAPRYGRAFSDDEGAIGNEHAIMLSHRLWHDAYGGDPSILGQDIRLSEKPFRVVGIMPPDFAFPSDDAGFWIPLAFSSRDRSDEARHSNGWYNIGRLKRGASLAQVREQLKAIDTANFSRLTYLQRLLVQTGFYTSVEPLEEVLVRPLRARLYLLWGGAIFMLLIGGANVVNVTLARANTRRREFATRLALGARRSLIVRQVVVEGLLLAALGGIAGAIVSAWLLSVWQAAELARIPAGGLIHGSGTAVGFALLVTVMVGLGIGSVSAIPLLTMSVGQSLQEDVRWATAGRTARRARHAFIIAQVACSFVLLAAAGLLLASFRNMLAVDSGFTVDGVTTAWATLPRARYAAGDQVRGFTDRALQAIRAIPGIEAAGASTVMPFSGLVTANLIVAEGYVPRGGESVLPAVSAVVTPGYFEAIGTPLVRGRYFDERDRNAIIIGERLARRFWPVGDAVGKRMYRPRNPQDLVTTDATQWLTVVGVVRDARLRELGDAGAEATHYLPYAAAPSGALAFIMRSRMRPDLVAGAVRSALATIDPEVPLFDIRTLSDRAERSLLPQRSAVLIAGFCGIVAVFLCAVGIYGVLSYLVTRRRGEIGIRMAMGSTPRHIFGLVFSEAARLVGIGLVAGFLGVVGLRRLLASQLYGVDALNPAILISMAVAVALISFVAAFSPAKRAMRVDVIRTLNSQ